MRRLALLFLMMAVLFTLSSCGGGPEPQPETPVVDIEPEPEPEPPVVDVEPEPEPEPEPILDGDFRIVYFDFDKYNLVDSAKMALELNARIMQENTDVIVKLEGHCDERGTVEYNLSLGDKRARSVLDYLEGLGIRPTRMETVSYGKSRPAANGNNEAAWAKNRRVEFRVVSQ